MKKILAIILALIFVLSMAACEGTQEQSGEAAGEVKYKETVTYVPSLKFVTTDTMNTTSGTSLSLYYLVYNNLLEADTVTGELVPGLAVSWELLAPDLYEFTLREGVKFHDGTEFTAEDVEFTFNRAKEQGASAGKVTTIDHVEVTDTYKIKFYLTGPDADFLYRLPDGRLSILCKKAFETMDAEAANMIGTGPFKYVEVKIDDHVTLTRNDDYWGELPKTKNLIYQEIPEQSSRLIALQNGEVDIISSPAATDKHYIEEDPDLVFAGYPGANLRYIGLNLNDPAFADIRVRQAIGYGINRAEYIAVTYDGNAVEVNNMMNPINEFYAEIDGYTYDPDKAKALLEEAGVAPGTLTISITGMQNAADTAFSTIFQSQMKSIGIEVTTDLLETATFTAKVKPDSGEAWQAEVNGWGGYINGPDNALRYLAHSASSGNAAHLNSPELDELIEKAALATDKAERKELYKQIEEMILANACYFPICVPTNDYAMSADLEGMNPPQGSIHHLRNLAVPEK